MWKECTFSTIRVIKMFNTWIPHLKRSFQCNLEENHLPLFDKNSKLTIVLSKWWKQKWRERDCIYNFDVLLRTESTEILLSSSRLKNFVPLRRNQIRCLPWCSVDPDWSRQITLSLQLIHLTTVRNKNKKTTCVLAFLTWRLSPFLSAAVKSSC